MYRLYLEHVYGRQHVSVTTVNAHYLLHAQSLPFPRGSQLTTFRGQQVQLIRFGGQQVQLIMFWQASISSVRPLFQFYGSDVKRITTSFHCF